MYNADGPPAQGEPQRWPEELPDMKDRIARDRLAVKLFYTACCVFAGLFVVPLMLLVDSPDKWEHPDARGIATVYVLMIAVLLPIWVPFIRRTTTSFPRSPLEAVRAIWAVFAPIAAMFLVWIPLAIPSQLYVRFTRQ